MMHCGARSGGDPDIDWVVESVLRRLDRLQVGCLLTVLTDLQRQAVELYFFDGLTSLRASALLGAMPFS